MPIIEMKKAFLLGHRQEREKIFNLLHEFGSIQLLDITSSKGWDDFEELLEPEELAETAQHLDTRLAEARYCLDFLQRHFPLRKNFVQQFTGSKLELTEEQFSNYIAESSRVKQIYDSCRQNDEELARLRNEETQALALIEELKPWQNLDVPLQEVKDGAFVSMGLCMVGTDRFDALKSSLAESGMSFDIFEISSDNEYNYFLLVYLISEREEIITLLKDNTVSSASFSGRSGTAADNMKQLEQQIKNFAEQRSAVLTNIEELLETRPLLMSCYDFLDNELRKESAVTNLARTEKSFLLAGWVPVPVLDDFQSKITGETETAVLVLRDPLPGEEVPVLLHNSGPAEAYEVVTKLYSTPRKSELDPTPYMAPFFFIFFGICLSDAGYGIVLSLLSLFIMRKLKLGGMGKQLVRLLFFGGLSAVVFGVLLGSVFGDLFKFPALWFNPLDDPMQMLFYCFGLGLIHIYFGMGLQAYRNIKAGHPLSALFDQGIWFLFLNGLIMLLIPQFSPVGRWLAIGGAVGLILTQGRSQQGIVKKFMSGLVSLYNITGYLSDVLSYSRLLALGLATGVIASAINSMGGMISGTVIGTIIMVLVLFGGHLFNIIISTLGSYVHTSRLQYIEFFGKFFEGGGRSFIPFGQKTSYVDIVEGEKGAVQLK